MSAMAGRAIAPSAVVAMISEAVFTIEVSLMLFLTLFSSSGIRFSHHK